VSLDKTNGLRKYLERLGKKLFPGGPIISGYTYQAQRVYLVLEEFLSRVTKYWALIMGPLLLLIVLFGRGGIVGLLGRLRRG
jgi:ABC-type branched-subunit amino acid transport system permease subunit